MQMRNYFLLPMLTVLCICFSGGALAKDSFANIFIFGDSLSDTGNVAATSDFQFLNAPPYVRGFSNGPRGVEVLAERLELSAAPSLHLTGPVTGTNFAISGARARSRGEPPIDLGTQIGAFLLNSGGLAPTDALYIVFIGANDVRDARNELPGVSLKIIGAAVASIDDAIRTLVNAGARSIMVVNSPDIGVLPETQAIAETTNLEFLPARATLLTRIFNTQLLRRLNRIERNFQIDLIHVDLFSLFQFAIENATALGFTNVDEGCFSSVTLMFNPACDSGANFDRFLFFDEIHPTGRTHERIGRDLFTRVPEPATDLE